MHLFKTRLKCLLRNKTLIFWTLLFPLILSTLFKFAFTNITEVVVFNTINISVIESVHNEQEFISFLESVEITEGKKMFNVTLANSDEAMILLDNNQVTGIIEIKEDFQIFLTIKGSGLSETILKTFLDDYVQTSATFSSIIFKSGGTVDINTLLTEMSNSKNYLSDLDRGLSYPNLLLIYFFAILGQTLIYGGVWGVNEIINLQANLSTKGLRVSISPTKRLKLLLINMGCAFVIHFSEVLIFLLFINYVLGVSFGANAFNILLLCVIGSFAGISFGAFIGISLKKASEMVKYGITQIVGVFGAFLSGMMYANMKYWVNTNAPILGYINPVNIIADGLYSLYYFPNKERYTFNMIILVVMCIIFVAGIYANFRRDNYESV